MKKIAILVVLCSLLIVNINKSNGQKSFSGTITYSMKYEGNIDQQTKDMAPKETVIKISGTKTKTEIEQGPVHVINIKDGDKKETITLMDISMLGKKIMMVKSSEEIKKDIAKSPVPTVKILDETKEIAGYKCKKAEITTKNEDGTENKSYIYFTEEIGKGDVNFDNPLMKEIKGLPMEYTTNSGNFSVVMTVTKVKKQKISDDEFVVPSGYEKMTMEQFQQMLQGGQ